MSKIVGYKIVEAIDPVGLAFAVNQEMEDGWQPLGGAIAYDGQDGAAHYHDRNRFKQTLVKYHTPKLLSEITIEEFNKEDFGSVYG